MTQEPRYKAGDVVIYTNDYGVCWGERTIVSVADFRWSGGEPLYYITPTDSPWCPKPERNLAEPSRDA